MSCHSCHINGHTNHQLNDNFSDQSFNTPKLVISLLGRCTPLMEPFAWNGSRPNLTSQIQNSVAETMHGKESLSLDELRALEAYLAKLPPPPSILEARGEIDASSIQHGRDLFENLQCGECHPSPSYTSTGLFDVGLADESDWRRFNPPSLIGVGQRDRFLHDGRTESLDDLFRNVRHQLPRELSDDERVSLITFLKSL
jgi:mono/diheme cytochrome c family protein